jgi:hypothetical protein
LPRKAEWTHRLPEVLAELRTLSAPAVDRAAVERLWGVSARQALRIMHRFGPQAAGSSMMIQREELIRQLEQMAEGGPVRFEHERRERLTSELERQRRQAAAQLVAVPVPPPEAGWQTLSDGIRLEPGRLEIRFQSGEQLLGLLLELAHAVAGDLEQFQATIGEAANSNSAAP